MRLFSVSSAHRLYFLRAHRCCFILTPAGRVAALGGARRRGADVVRRPRPLSLIYSRAFGKHRGAGRQWHQTLVLQLF